MTEDDYIDIQSMLRACDFYFTDGTKSDIPEIAADFIDKSVTRIEQLEAALRTVKEWHGYGLPPETTRMIDAALEGKND